MVMRIKELRQSVGLDQIAFGQAVGASQGTVSDWENERYLPKTRQLPLIAEVLGVPIGDLFVSQPRDCNNDNTFEGA